MAYEVISRQAAGMWGAAGQWEFDILQGLQGIHGPWLDRMMTFITGLADHGELWLLLGVLFLCFSKTRRLGATVLLAAGLGFVTGNLILKNLFARSRPCWLMPQIPLLIPVPMDYSFPSGHTLVSFEGAFSVWRHNRRWGIMALAAAAAIAFSRMYLFVHFPTDILGGMVLGIVNGWAAEKMVSRLTDDKPLQNGKAKEKVTVHTMANHSAD